MKIEFSVTTVEKDGSAQVVGTYPTITMAKENAVHKNKASADEVVGKDHTIIKEYRDYENTYTMFFN